MTEVERQLLAAIRDAPYDNAPRLVYADWLSERGDPRGEFIAAQILRSVESRDMWVELLREHATVWAAHVHEIIGAKYRFERGFVDYVELTSFDDFRRHRHAIVNWIPIPEIDIRGDPCGEVVISPDREFAALVERTSEDWGARGVHHHRVIDVDSDLELGEHIYAWRDPKHSVARCWFPAGLRTLVIEYEDDRPPTDLRF